MYIRAMSLLSVAAAALYCRRNDGRIRSASFFFLYCSFLYRLPRSLVKVCTGARLPQLNARRNKDTKSPSTCRSRASFQGYAAVEIGDVSEWLTRIGKFSGGVCEYYPPFFSRLNQRESVTAMNSRDCKARFSWYETCAPIQVLDWSAYVIIDFV